LLKGGFYLEHSLIDEGLESLKYYLVQLNLTMESITIKLEERFLHLIEVIMKRNQYTTKTEFIREAIRDKINDLETKAALKRLEKIYGSSKRRTTDEELHKAGERAVEELERKFGLK